MELKDRIKTARKAVQPKLTQAMIADALNVTPQAVSGWERGEAEPEADKFSPLAKLLHVDVRWLHGEDVAEAPEPYLVDTQAADDLIPKEALHTSDRADLPIYASAEGGPGQIIRSSEPIDFQPRPVILARVKGAYGLIITGDSMEPEYRNGDTALVNPHLPPQSGEVHIFYSQNPAGEAKATIKHLRRATSDKWMVTQHNPPEGLPKDFALPRLDWTVVHRVLGKYARR